MSRILSALVLVAAFGCSSSGDDVGDDPNPSNTTTCCECACGETEDYCAFVVEEREGPATCSNVCRQVCSEQKLCDTASVADATSCSGADSKTDDPCERTCAILDSCGITTYADQGDCRDNCDQGDQQVSDVVCLEEAACDTEMVQSCLAAMPGNLAQSVTPW